MIVYLWESSYFAIYFWIFNKQTSKKMAIDSFDVTEQTMRTPGGALDDRLLEEEYLKAEKGKMNTLSVFAIKSV